MYVLHIKKEMIQRSVIQRVLLIAVFILLFSYPVYGESGLEITSIEGGFDGMYKINGWAPLVINVKNNGDDFNGNWSGGFVLL